ncbi:MAG: histidinol-phosphatase family [Clostridia bacterium]|jgi:histidinol-phosphatase (PHP family)|nr:histidinol-phosphatase family [Clostridia bacterium]
MLTDYHIHIENGDYTLSWLERFVKKAKDLGIEELGISEHCYRFIETSHIFNSEYWNKRRTESLLEYLDLLKEANKTGMRIKKSTEFDYIPGLERKIEEFLNKYNLDYVIGSIHWLDNWGFDVPEMKAIWDKSDIKEVYMKYFDIICSMADSQLFDVVGHFDIIKVFGYEPQKFDRDILNVIEKAVQKIKDNKMCIEISTAGLRKPVGEIYPKKNWLKLFYEAGVPIVLSSDAHYPEDVGADYKQAIALANEVGYEKIAVFKDRKYKLMPLG